MKARRPSRARTPSPVSPSAPSNPPRLARWEGWAGGLPPPSAPRPSPRKPSAPAAKRGPSAVSPSAPSGTPSRTPPPAAKRKPPRAPTADRLAGDSVALRAAGFAPSPHFAEIDGQAVPCLALPPRWINGGFAERIPGKVFCRLSFILYRKRGGGRAMRFRWNNDPAATEAERGLILETMRATVAAATRAARKCKPRLRAERIRAERKREAERTGGKGTAKK